MKKTLGILGAGQLARMLALAGHELGLKTICYDTDAATSAAAVSEVVRGQTDSDLLNWAVTCDLITYETENIALDRIDLLHQSAKPLFPSRRALELMQNRKLEKTFLRQLGLPTVDFVRVNNDHSLEQAITELGYPCILKTTTQGYDGKGQYRLQEQSDRTKLNILWDQEYILESWLSFEAECSLCSVRGQDGAIAHYSLTRNWHEDGILVRSEAPWREGERLEQKAQEMAERILTHLDYVGVLTLEFFVKAGNLWINEMAPRVHNSFHWTIEGAKTSQFSNHLRALLGYPLGSTAAIADTVLFNCIGRMPAIKTILSYPDVYYHDYEKTPRAGRKLGHLTYCDFEKQNNGQILEQLAIEISNVY